MPYDPGELVITIRNIMNNQEENLNQLTAGERRLRIDFRNPQETEVWKAKFEFARLINKVQYELASKCIRRHGPDSDLEANAIRSIEEASMWVTKALTC